MLCELEEKAEELHKTKVALSDAGCLLVEWKKRLETDVTTATTIKWNINDIEPPMLTRLLVTTIDGYVDVDTCSTCSGWYDNEEDVIAWAHMPEPYTAPDGEEDS
ncbi:hypothetical protein ACQ86O_17960 [Serratia sp. L9]|uniref:hypothetical protein n=1 Tax=Serratia sp. L9 TaxID=3423946 RepID=UPI003D675693